MAIAVIAVVEAHWGWSIRSPGFSAGGPPLPVPPPSTVAVALLAHSLSKAMREVIGSKRSQPSYSSRIAAEALYTAAAGLLEGYVVLASDTMRYLTVPYQRPANRSDPKLWFAAQAFGVAVAPATTLCLASVYDEEKLAMHGIMAGDVVESAHSITRLGAREGLVSLREAWVSKASRGTSGGGEETILYAPRGSFLYEESIGYRIVEVEAWDPWAVEAYSPRPPGRKTLPPSLPLSLPVGGLSGGGILFAPESPAELRGNVAYYEAEEGPEECRVIPVLQPTRGPGG